MYTIAESLQPFSKAFGDAVNSCYSATSRNLSIFETIPLSIASFFVFFSCFALLSFLFGLFILNFEVNIWTFFNTDGEKKKSVKLHLHRYAKEM